MRRGRRLAIDVGKARIGLALCDADGILSAPLEAIARSDASQNKLSQLVAELLEDQLIEIYVGNPLSLSGKETPSTIDAVEFAEHLAKNVPIPIRLIDERLSTVLAGRKLREAGRNSKNSKSFIDSASAVEILERALDAERFNGEAPGSLIEIIHD